MDPNTFVPLVQALGPSGAAVAAVLWFLQRYEAQRKAESDAAAEQRRVEREASKEIMEAHLARVREIAEANHKTAETIQNVMVSLQGIIGEIRGVSRAGEKA